VVTRQKVFIISLHPEDEPQNRELEDKVFLYMTLDHALAKNYEDFITCLYTENLVLLELT